MPDPEAWVRRPVVLVTGVSTGIGRAVAVELARRGHRVFGAGRRPEAAPPGVEPVTMDVRDDDSVTAAVALVLDRAGRLDAVVNNAGIAIGGPVEDTSTDEARAMVETNVLGVWRVCRAVLPAMRARGNGMIVNMGSVAGLVGTPFVGGYTATKFAVEGLSETLRLEVRPFGIHVAVIEPGLINTGMAARSTRTAALSDAYRAHADRVLDEMVADEAAGLPAEAVGRLVARVVNTARPRLRYTVGPPGERAFPLVKRLLPWAACEAILRRAYRLG
jgi:NAD(P)-dependent dehydrogenase (short-subunit alcohol dehydrogenase family)